MSALGHYLEEEGIATVAISLIRPQTEKTKPPRALWVPFELGRPFGPPSDPAFQKKPRASRQSRASPFIPAGVAAGSDGSLAARLVAEIVLLRDAHQRWVAQHGRTTVGLSGLPISECARYVADWLRGTAPASPREGFSAPLMLRFAVDDVKAYCLEAAAAEIAKPSSRQLGDWFWNETAAGATIHALREACLSSEDERLKLIAGNFMVPAARVRGSG